MSYDFETVLNGLYGIWPSHYIDLRPTLELSGSPAGKIAYRFVSYPTHEGYIDNLEAIIAYNMVNKPSIVFVDNKKMFTKIQELAKSFGDLSSIPTQSKGLGQILL